MLDFKRFWAFGQHDIPFMIEIPFIFHHVVVRNLGA